MLTTIKHKVKMLTTPYNYDIMRKIIFLVAFLLVSCEKYVDYENSPLPEEFELKYLKKQNNSSDEKPPVFIQEHKIRFLEFEASTFEVSVLTDKTTDVYIGFFRADDIDDAGKAKTGKSIIRLQKISVPQEEMIEHYDRNGVELTRFDGSKHLIKFVPSD